MINDIEKKSVDAIMREHSSYTRAPLMSVFTDMPTLSRKPVKVRNEKPLWEQIQDEIKMLKELIEKVPS